MKLRITHSLSLALLLVPTAVLADYQDDIGYRALEDAHQLISRGANLKVGQVEAPIDGAYMPDRGLLDFLGKHIYPLGLLNSSGHATTVGQMIYGPAGIAPDVSTINVYNSNSFLTASTGLAVGQRQAPAKFKVSVLNNSWIAAFNSNQQNIDAIRRLDFVINRDDVVVVSSVDNGAGSAYPKLLATTYNGIAVGILDGSSDGPVTFDSRGPRAKPDLVVPIDKTSWAAGAVSGAAALIRSEGKARQMNVSELTTKALLMAGANKPDDWERGAPGTQDDEKVPLDYRYGAGSLRVDNSFDILVSGQHPQGGVDTGWDTAMAKKRNHVYAFNIADDDAGGDNMEAFTAVLTWNRQIKRSVRGAYSSSMADLEMSLLIKNGAKWARVSRSDSDFDNLETITLNDLAPGAYRLVVRGDRPQPYSVAWFTSLDDHSGGSPSSGPGGGGGGLGTLGVNLTVGGLSATVVPEPALLTLLFPAAAMLAARRQKKPR
jgi:hypothetical protein